MEKSEIIEASKLFARYLGYEYYPKIDGEKHPGWRLKSVEPHKIYFYSKLSLKDYPLGVELCRQHTALRFYNSWDWLLLVYKQAIKELNNSPLLAAELNNAILNVDLKSAFEYLYKILK